MKTGIPILAAALALTVFITSLVLETQDSHDHRASIQTPAVDAILSGSKGLLSHYESQSPGLLTSKDASETNQQLEQLRIEAARLMEAGNVDAAMEVIRRALKLDQNNVNLLRMLGTRHFFKREYALAEAYLQRLSKSGYEVDLTSRSKLGVAQMRQGKFEEALQSLHMVLEKEPTDGALHFALACTHAELHNQQSALYHLELAYAQLGLNLLSHISDSHLDNLRDTRKFQRIVRSLRSLDQKSSHLSSSQAYPVAK